MSEVSRAASIDRFIANFCEYILLVRKIFSKRGNGNIERSRLANGANVSLRISVLLDLAVRSKSFHFCN